MVRQDVDQADVVVSGKPAVLAVIVGVGGVARTRSDGVHVVPIDMLGP